jgi:hypothetical protein
MDPGRKASHSHCLEVERITGNGPSQGRTFKAWVGFGDFIRTKSPRQKTGCPFFILSWDGLLDF